MSDEDVRRLSREARSGDPDAVRELLGWLERSGLADALLSSHGGTVGAEAGEWTTLFSVWLRPGTSAAGTFDWHVSASGPRSPSHPEAGTDLQCSAGTASFAAVAAASGVVSATVQLASQVSASSGGGTLGVAFRAIAVESGLSVQVSPSTTLHAPKVEVRWSYGLRPEGLPG